MIESKAPTPPEQGKLIPSTPGAMLRDARESSGQSHAAVGEALHLTVHYIKALENDDYSKLPGLIFVKGYIRSYGHYLKMDVDALIRSYDAHVGSLGESAGQSQNIQSYDRRQQGRRRNDQSHGWALVAGFIVIIALGAGWWFYGRGQDLAETSGASPSTSPNTPVAANRNSADAQAVARPFSTAATTTSPASAGNTTSASSSTISAPIPGTLASTLSQTASTTDMTTTNPATMTGSVATDGVSGVTADTAAAAENALPTADVTSAATAITPNGEVIQSAANAPALLQTTVTDEGITVIPAADGTRQLSMFRAGNDELQLHFAGDSWVEIDDGSNVRLYSDMINSGDTLTIQGTAPFQVLLGNARAVQVNFNDSAVDIAASIREDNTARVQLANPDNEAPIAGTGVAQ